MRADSSKLFVIDPEQAELLKRSEPLDCETMEAAGYFHKEFALVPRNWAERHWSSWDRAPGDFRGPYCVWWYRESPAINVSAYCDFFWQRSDPIGQCLDDSVNQVASIARNGHRLEMTRNRRGKITELYFCVDLRTDSCDFIQRCLALTKAAKCLLLDYEKFELVELLERHVATRLANVESTYPILYGSKHSH